MTLKIATWNLQRPRASSAKNSTLMEEIGKVNADILVLTETHSIIHPGKQYRPFSTNDLSKSSNSYYRAGEIRTTVWSKFPATGKSKTFDSDTSICTRIPTEFGELNVYGTVIGIFGNRHPSFLPDLNKQIADWKRISKSSNICIAGDFNLSFADAYYYTKAGRQLTTDCFQELRVRNLTTNVKDNIDHIAISESFVMGAKITTGVWNEDKKLSDHKGVWAILKA